MAEIVNMHEAKTQLSKLVAQVEQGDEFVIARGGRPCARLVPIETGLPRLATMKNRWPVLTDDFFAPLDDDELEDWGT